MEQTQQPTPKAVPAEPVPTPSIIAAMLRASPKISDLIFSPGRAPQIEANGQLVQVNIPGVGVLSAEDTARIAADLIGRNAHAVDKLKQEGSCDISYSLAKVSRFRVNVFTQRGSCAIVMRVIASSVPDFKALNLPSQLAEAAELRPGIVLVTGPTGITIEDPIEFLHNHKRSTIHQRELHFRRTELRARPPRRSAASSQADTCRRNARPRNNRSGSRRRGNWPLSLFDPPHH